MTPDLYERAPWLHDVAAEELRRIVDVLYRVHRFIAVITDLDTLLERIMEESKGVAQAEACSLMLFDERTEELYFQIALGESGDQQLLKREIRLKRGQGIAGTAAANREAVNVADVRSDPRFFRDADAVTRFETRSLLAVPLVDRERLVGVLEVVNKVGGPAFTETDLRVMQMFSGLVATVIANARLIEENLRAARLAAIGQAMAGLSHYTKNIITGMTAAADLIDQGLAGHNVDVLTRTWPVFKRSTKRIANFVEDMLAYSKPREPLYQICDVRAIIEEVSETFFALLARKHVELKLELAGLTGPAWADARGLYRCLLNMMMNAGHAVPDQGGCIRVSARNMGRNGLELEVADNGPGVPEELTHRIFEPFFSTKGTQGTGLGLAVTSKIVAEHHGQIEVLRAPEGGALFRITLPEGETPITPEATLEEEWNGASA